jgi:hypothetical protein
MLEKLAAAVTIAGTFVALCVIKMMDLPIFITVPLSIVAVIICLIGIVFLFAEGTILPSARRVEKAPKAGETLKETAS